MSAFVHAASGRDASTRILIFDVQAKRLHEYKRQLLNALRILMLYNRIDGRSRMCMSTPRTLSVRGQGVARATTRAKHDHQAD